MSYFNDEQRDHMRSLEEIPPAERCWCGWYRLGQCRNCPASATCADKLAARCPQCRNAPSKPGGTLVHLVTCPASEERA